MAKGPGTYLYVGLRAQLVNFDKYDAKDLIDQVNRMRAPHCTLMYAKIEGKSKVFHSRSEVAYATGIVDVVYIPHADCTCLILEKTASLVNRHNYFKNMGLDLGYEFAPHVTVCQGNQVKLFQALIGVEVNLNDEYIQVIVKE